jgi:hypothetical protein
MLDRDRSGTLNRHASRAARVQHGQEMLKQPHQRSAGRKEKGKLKCVWRTVLEPQLCRERFDAPLRRFWSTNSSPPVPPELSANNLLFRLDLLGYHSGREEGTA